MDWLFPVVKTEVIPLELMLSGITTNMPVKLMYKMMKDESHSFLFLYACT